MQQNDREVELTRGFIVDWNSMSGQDRWIISRIQTVLSPNVNSYRTAVEAQKKNV